MFVSNGFRPPFYLRNGHLQSILASVGPRKVAARAAASALRKAARAVTLKSSCGARLIGFFSQNPVAEKGIVTFIHGWEGSSESSYILSAGARLFESGYSVFRLNMRDHGPSKHLNREPFNSCRVGEVAEAVREAGKLHEGGGGRFLAGYSLGGNFAVRVSGILGPPELDRTVAVCPVLDPYNAMVRMEEGAPIYRRYFVYKWRRSMAQKSKLFPDLGIDLNSVGNTLGAMHDSFVPRFTPYGTTREYFNSYAVTNDSLGELKSPCHIILSEDDPVIPASDIEAMRSQKLLSAERAKNGGHCGFIKNMKLESWVDERLIELFGGE